MPTRCPQNTCSRPSALQGKARRATPAAGSALATCTALLLGLGVAGPADAVPVFELSALDALVALNNINSGIGTAGTRIDAGTLTSDSLQPGALALQGEGSDFAASIVFTSALSATWNIGQSFELVQLGNDTQLNAAGALQLQASATNCSLDQCSTSAVVGYVSQNFQVFEFTLSEAADYSAQGESAKDQIVNLDLWDQNTQTWQNYGGWNEGATYGGTSLIGPQQITPWTLNGSLDAGLYRLSNGPFNYTNPTYPTTSWAYSITLADTQLAQPVPEPAALLLMGLGVAALLARRRCAA